MQICKLDFQNSLGLSCIENYVIACIKKYSCFYPLAFYKSHLSAKRIFELIYTNNIEYAFFSGIPRIQDLCLQHRAIVGTFKEDVLPLKKIDLIEHLLCIQVRPQFTKDYFHNNVWRNDHYVLIQKNGDGKLTLINDSPLFELQVDYDFIARIYAGRYFLFSPCAKVQFDENDCLFELLQSMSVEKVNEGISFSESISLKDILKIRDFVGVLRILRKRIELILSCYIDTKCLRNSVAEMDRLYSTMEYYRLRKKWENNIVKQCVLTTIYEDTKQIAKLRKQLEDYLCAKKYKS